MPIVITEAKIFACTQSKVRGEKIAKAFGATVYITAGNSKKCQFCEQLGAQKAFNYKQEDFTKKGQNYDLILDAKTTRSTFDYLRALNPSGKYVTVGGYLNRLFPMLLLKP